MSCIKYRLLEVEKKNSDIMNSNSIGSGGTTNPAFTLKHHQLLNGNFNARKGEPYDASNGLDRRPAALVRRFGDLYSMARLDTLDALDNIDDLETFTSPNSSSSSSACSTSSFVPPSATGITRKNATSEELKNKLLFSVIVVCIPICCFSCCLY